jgi:hypothetical protein
MARTKTIEISALNIVLPAPHRSERYRELWMRAFELNTAVALRSDIGGMIGSAKVDDGRGQPIWGDLYKFVNIEMDGRWLDLSTRRRASQEDVARQVRIPPAYRPNMRSVPYFFVPTKHRLIFISHLDVKNALRPNMAQALIERTLHHGAIVDEFGKAEVTVEPDHETLRRIFAMPRLKYLHIEVVPPNALDRLERRVYQRMANLKANRLVEELQSSHPEGLQLDDATKNLATVAESNGVVNARGENANGKVEHLSTKDHPLSEKVTFDPDITPPREVLAAEAPNIVARINDVAN